MTQSATGILLPGFSTSSLSTCYLSLSVSQIRQSGRSPGHHPRRHRPDKMVEEQEHWPRQDSSGTKAVLLLTIRAGSIPRLAVTRFLRVRGVFSLSKTKGVMVAPEAPAIHRATQSLISLPVVVNHCYFLPPHPRRVLKQCKVLVPRERLLGKSEEVVSAAEAAWELRGRYHRPSW